MPTKNWMVKPPLKPSIQLKAFRTPITQKIVNKTPNAGLSSIVPKPNKFPKLSIYKPDWVIRIKQAIAWDKNLVGTVKPHKSSIKVIKARMIPVIYIHIKKGGTLTLILW